MAEKGRKRGRRGRKTIIAKKKKMCPIPSNNCAVSESVKQTKNIYNLS